CGRGGFDYFDYW
nr:immunoglobulin heavy chain junction region [Mus musculus]